MRQPGVSLYTAGAQSGRIKIAIQKSGRLTDNSLELLTRCGLKYSRGRDQLACFGENLPLDILLVRDDDIPTLVQDDVCDLGIVGQNVIEEKRLALAAAGFASPFQEVMPLDFGRCRLALAVPEEATYAGRESLRGQRIATSYPRLVATPCRKTWPTAKRSTSPSAWTCCPAAWHPVSQPPLRWACRWPMCKP
jgi:ATP phosphoribosyltransferase